MTITIVIPAYNEEGVLKETLEKLFSFLDGEWRGNETVRVVVADNGSTDATAPMVKTMQAQEKRLTLFSVPERGKGNAVFSAWRQFPADYSIFFDADLATDLFVLPELVRALREGADIAVASRFAPGAIVLRSLLRHTFSRILQAMLWVVFRLQVRDAPCGMKAVTRAVVATLVPLVRDRAWFFDTELLVRAERKGLRIAEVPARWSDAADKKRASRVGVVRVAWHYCKAIALLRFTL